MQATFTLTISYSNLLTNVIENVTMDEAVAALSGISKALKKTRAVVTLTEE